MDVPWWRLRVLLVDGLLAVTVGGLFVLWWIHAPLAAIPPSPHREAGVAAYTLVAIPTAALLVRRFWPWVTFGVTMLPMAVYLAATFPYGPIFFPLAVGMYTVATRASVRNSGIACAAGLLLMLVAHVVGDVSGLLSRLPLWLGVGGSWLLIPWCLGSVVATVREADVRKREEEARRYADEERLRIAREVHDVVGHGLAAINMQSGVALHVLERRPEQARPALEAIKKTSKESLDELRGTLAVFRGSATSTTSTKDPPGVPHRDTDGGVQDPEQAPARPRAGMGELDDLVSRMADSGLRVDVTGHDAAGDLPAGVDLAAYRIIQESLTNVLRHAATDTATVRVHRGHGEVTVDVTDSGVVSPDTAGNGSVGTGITGMTERASAVGGSLEAGPRPGGGFRVTARLPVRE